MLHIGTSGFSYKDWVGEFYPEGTPSSGMFDLYCREFATVELDYTYYTMPSKATMERLVNKAPEGFRFSVRTHKSITHDKDAPASDVLDAVRLFCSSLSPLSDKGMMGCILVQYPWSFRRSTQNMDTMLRTAQAFEGFEVAVEFRNDTWADEKVLDTMRANGIALCCVDEPRIGSLFPPIAAVTAEHAYVRFHGRNSRDWWHPASGSDRYNYDYSDEELDEWIPGIHEIISASKDTYIYMNNCHMGKAAKNARTLKKKLMANA